ncbi:unnamed protein product [Paramecium octaurelia]|uniref:Uncharacterized protein n=1 Tax=Paramecium octaurelia TaxID=43137 RepID=A0A8S1YKM8_PAROT|nr:unnamed protein product [Paramecium octaurelia]
MLSFKELQKSQFLIAISFQNQQLITQQCNWNCLFLLLSFLLCSQSIKALRRKIINIENNTNFKIKGAKLLQYLKTLIYFWQIINLISKNGSFKNQIYFSTIKILFNLKLMQKQSFFLSCPHEIQIALISSHTMSNPKYIIKLTSHMDSINLILSHPINKEIFITISKDCRKENSISNQSFEVYLWSNKQRFQTFNNLGQNFFLSSIENILDQSQYLKLKKIGQNSVTHTSKPTRIENLGSQDLNFSNNIIHGDNFLPFNILLTKILLLRNVTIFFIIHQINTLNSSLSFLIFEHKLKRLQFEEIS